MNRSTSRNITGLMLFCMVVSSGLLWLQVQKQQAKVEVLQGNLTTRQNELANLNFLVAAQDKLDELTMDERRSTQLDVLKYLGLEKIKLDFRLDGRESRSIGDTALVVRTVTVQAKKSYQETMELVDRLFASGKFNIVNLTLRKGDENIPESTSLLLQGRLFSLNKQGEIEGSVNSAQGGTL
jgi:hypothetical protein